MTTVLVTAFDPFGNSSCNPSALVVSNLPENIAGAAVRTAVLPTVFGASTEMAIRFIKNLNPDVVVMLGQAAGRAAVTPERVAINIDDARIPDNDGNSPIDKPIDASGPAAYFSTLPIKAITQAITKAGYAAAVSNTAGTFVCNHLFYGVMHWLAENNRSDIRAGFIHIPAIPEQELGEKIPTTDLDSIVKAVEIAIHTAVSTVGDIRVEGGSLL